MPAEHEGGKGGGGGGGGAVRAPDPIRPNHPSSLGGRKRMKMWGPSFLARLGRAGPGRYELSLEPNIPVHGSIWRDGGNIPRIFHSLRLRPTLCKQKQGMKAPGKRRKHRCTI
jgi:hypothetical protein